MAREDATVFGESANELAVAGIPRVGEVFAGKYRVERVIGLGGMGVVLAATHLAIGEPVAIKLLLPKSAKNEDAVERFLREARAAVRIKSEHIVRVSDVGQREDGSPYMIMEYLEGRDLGARLAEVGPMAVTDAVEYVLQASTGIAEAHALGIVHRDLKPSNLFLTTRADGAPFVKVLDFGISKNVDETHAPALTQTRETFGSPAYMSPEQIRSAKNVDARTDVWSLGVILYELLTARTPFVAETAGGLLSAIAADEPERLRAHVPGASEALESIILRCLAKQPANRFQSVSELAAALEPFRGPKSIVSIGRIKRLSTQPAALESTSSARQPVSSPTAFAATDGPVTTGARSTRRSPVLAIVAAIVVAGGLAGGGLLLSRMNGHQAASASADPSGVTTPVATAPASASVTANVSATASAITPASASASEAVSARPALRRVAPKPSASAAPPTTAHQGAVAPPPPAKTAAPEPTLDPTGQSH